MAQKKLVQAFKAFVQKSVLPLNSTNDVLINDWKHFNNIISSDPIDPNQLDFYLYVINRQSTNLTNFNKTPLERQTVGNISQFGKLGIKKPKQFNISGLNNSPMQMNTNGISRQNIGQKTSSSLVGGSVMSNSTSNGSKRKNLIANMQNFQNLLVKNHQKLQNYNRSIGIAKDGGFNTSITSNGATKKYY